MKVLVTYALRVPGSPLPLIGGNQKREVERFAFSMEDLHQLSIAVAESENEFRRGTGVQLSDSDVIILGTIPLAD